MFFKFYQSAAAVLICLIALTSTVWAQTYLLDMKRDSARSDKLTGGKIEKTALAAGDGDLKITINVPAFQMTLWQNGKEVKTYQVGVGMKDYPIYIGFRQATDVIWNPAWIPPDSDWVTDHKGVKPGEIIPAGDPRNPIGKVKIPLGDGYLIHQAKGIGDLGSLVSHGCVRVMLPDLYDLAEKIAAARSLDVTAKQIASAKTNKKTLDAKLETPIPVEITYDTQVVEAGKLHIYPDVYERDKNTVENLRAELKSNGVDDQHLTDETLAAMLKKAAAKKQFVVSLANLKNGGALKNGQIISVVGSGKIAPQAVKKQVVVKKTTRISKTGVER